MVDKVLTTLNVLDLNGKYDVRIDVIGGGLTGQAEASTLGLARAVLSIMKTLSQPLDKMVYLLKIDVKRSEKIW